MVIINDYATMTAISCNPAILFSRVENADNDADSRTQSLGNEVNISSILFLISFV